MRKTKVASRVFLNKSFYHKEAVVEALAEFKHGRFLNESMEIEIESGMEDEFCNYVMGLMRNKGLV
jgi:hypothetical protein